jgi:Mrp family chromosome partitioning ATPase
MVRSDYLDALVRRWWLILLVGVIGMSSAFFATPSHSKKTTNSLWSSLAWVGAAPPISASRLTAGSEIELSSIAYYSRQSSVISAAAAAAGIKKPIGYLENHTGNLTSVVKHGAAVEVGLLADGSSPEQSAAFTNAYAAALGNYISALAKQNQQVQLVPIQQRIAALQAKINSLGTKIPGSLTSQLAQEQAQEALLSVPPNTGYDILEPAQASAATRVAGGSSGLKSSRLASAAIGLIIGMMVGALIAVLLGTFDKSLRSAARAQEAFGFRIVTEIPVGQPDVPSRGKATVSSDAVQAVRHEAYQKLRMAVLLERLPGRSAVEDLLSRPSSDLAVSTSARFRSGDLETGFPVSRGSLRKVILVVSPGAEESRSLVVSELAAACAEAGQSTLVLESLGLHSAGSASEESGISEEITPDELERYIEPSRLHNVSLLSLVRLVGTSGQLLTKGAAIIGAARHLSDIVIIEAPPLLVFHDGEALATIADVVVVVGEFGSTSFEFAKRSGELLRRIDAPVIGVAFTNVPLDSKEMRQVLRAEDERRNHAEPARESILSVAGFSPTEGSGGTA